MQESEDVILVVDDHVDTAEVIVEMLSFAGFVAHTAGTGLEALRQYDALRPSLVMTDETLAGDITGSELVQILRRKYGPAVGPALFLTGSPGEVKCLPADVILEKPFGFAKLIAAVRSVLGGSGIGGASYM